MADSWCAVISAANPASLLVVIASRMGPGLRAHLDPEDLLQETLLAAWASRESFTWQGLPAFRSWLIRIATHRIEDCRDGLVAKKRDPQRTRPWDARGPEGTLSTDAGQGNEPYASTTPSRIASAREEARRMQQSLAELPDELRDVVRLRLFEDLPIEEIAARLGLGESAVRHRFRKGAEAYRKRLGTLRADRTPPVGPPPPPAGDGG